jgi:serine protease inhibitor ecotin
VADVGIGETIAAVGVAVSIASAAAATASAVQQAQQQQKAQQYNAQVQGNNAQVAEYQRSQQAQEAAIQSTLQQKQGATEASQLEMRNGQMVAKNIAAAASEGLSISGSAQDVISGSASNNELGVNSDEYKTQLQAYSASIGANNASYNSGTQISRYQDQQTLDLFAGNNAAQTGILSATGAGISGASRVGSALYQIFD